MWSAFITGFAGKTNELIEEKDNEIKKNMELQLKDMYASRKEAMSKAETRRDELRQAAAQLRSYGLEDTGIIKVLSSGNYQNISKLLENEAKSGRLTPQKIKSFIGEADPNIPESLDNFINSATQLTSPAGTKPLSTEARGAFGFKTRAAEDVTERFLKAQNLSREDIQKSTLVDMPMTGRAFDYSAIGEREDTFDKHKQNVMLTLSRAEQGSEEEKEALKAYRKIVAIEKLGDKEEAPTLDKIIKQAEVDLFNAETPEERNAATATITRAVAIKDTFKENNDELKESDVRSTLRILQNSILKKNAGPNDLVITTNDQGQEIVTIKGTLDRNLRDRINKEMVDEFNSYANQFYKKNGKVPEVVQRVLAAYTLQYGNRQGGAPTPTPPAGGGYPDEAARRGAAPPAAAPQAQQNFSITYIDEKGNSKTAQFPNKKAADDAFDLYTRGGFKPKKGY